MKQDSDSATRFGADLPPTKRVSRSRQFDADDLDPQDYSFLQPPVGEDELGRLGNYRVLRLLGTGGMGMVFEAEDIALGRIVALKVLRPEREQANSWQRFLREARAAAAFKHDHLVTVYQAGQENDTIYLAMEYLQGETLESWIVGQEQPPRTGEIVRIARQIIAGLNAIHQQGLIHRDIKPANIWLEASTNRVKILDFGLARDLNDDTKLTQSGLLVGTPAFLSPEQVRGKQADTRSDLFSFGCVLYCMCTRSVPFPAENTMAQLAALAADDPTPVTELNPSIPADLSQLIMELLEKKPDMRPQTAEEVAQRLQILRKSLTQKRRRPNVDVNENPDDEDAQNHPPGDDSGSDESEDTAPGNDNPRLGSVNTGVDDEDDEAISTRPIPRPQRRTGERGKMAKAGRTTRDIAKLKSKKNRQQKKRRWLIVLVGSGVALAALLAVCLFLVFAPPGDGGKGKEAPVFFRPGGWEVPEKAEYLSEQPVAASANWPFNPPAKKGKRDFKGHDPLGKGAKIADFISFNGKESKFGIFLHPAPHFENETASITYRLNGQFKQFHAMVSLNDSSKTSPLPITFHVYADGKEVWKSRPINSQADTDTCNIPVAGVNTLKLETRAPVGDLRGAHAVWFEPYLTR